MENFWISINAVLPMFLIIGLGCLARHKNMVSAMAVKEMNSLCFNLFMSAMMFNNVYTSDFSMAMNVPLALFCVVGILVEFGVGLLLVPRIEKSNEARGVMLQSFFRTNAVLLTIPIVAALAGAEGVAEATMVVAIIVPLYNVMAVISLEFYRGDRVDVGKIFRAIVKNPLIIGTVLGVVTVLSGLRIPSVLENAVGSLAKAASPIALLLMGASMNLGKLKASARNLTICVMERLVVMPALALALAVAMGFRGGALCTIMVMFGAPTAVNSYTMAVQMDGDADLAGGIVLTTTTISCITLVLWTWGLKACGLLF